MALTVTPKPYKTDIPEGETIGVCVGIYDIGTVENKAFQKKQPKVVFQFELPEHANEEGWPKTIDVTYTASLDPKSTLHRDLKGWLARGFRPEELRSFSLRPFLGKAATLLIIHKYGEGQKADNVYANVDTIRPVPKGVEAPEPQREPILFDFADESTVIPEGTPEFIAKKIMVAPEWAALKSGKKAAARKASGAAAVQAPAEIVDHLNNYGIAYPYDMDDLNEKYPAEDGEEVYKLLEAHAVPY